MPTVAGHAPVGSCVARMVGSTMSGGASPARAGATFERDVQHYLTGLGWFVVKAGGSRGCADLVALRSDHQPWLIQCKRTDSPQLPAQQWATLWLTAIDHGGLPVLVYKHGPGAARAGKGLEWRYLMAPQRAMTNLQRADPR